MLHSSLWDLFALQCALYESRKALFWNGRHNMTYKELAKRALALSKHISAFSDTHGEETPFVGIMCTTSVALVVSQLGIMAADCAFVPLDIANPFERRQEMISQLVECTKKRMSCIVVSLDVWNKPEERSWVQQLLENRWASKVLLVDLFGHCVSLSTSKEPARVNHFTAWNSSAYKELKKQASVACSATLFEEHSFLLPPSQSTRGKRLRRIAYVMFSSGTTGVPKVVQVPHSCVVPNILDFIRIWNVRSDDRLFLSTSCGFDPSIIEIYVALCSGASLVLAGERTRMSPSRLVHTLCDSRVTVFQCTPSLLFSVAHYWLLHAEEILQQLRVLALGGEPFPLPLLRYLFTGVQPDRLPLIYSLYGITECSVWATCAPVDIFSDEEVTLGRPLSLTSVHFQPLTEATPATLLHTTGPDRETRKDTPHSVDLPGVRAPICTNNDESSRWDHANLDEAEASGALGLLWIGAASIETAKESTCAEFQNDGRQNVMCRPERVCVVESERTASRMRCTGDIVQRSKSDPGRLFVYRGRINNSVKVRGSMVQLEQVVGVIERVPSVLKCCVIPVRASLTVYTTPRETRPDTTENRTSVGPVTHLKALVSAVRPPGSGLLTGGGAIPHKRERLSLEASIVAHAKKALTSSAVPQEVVILWHSTTAGVPFAKGNAADTSDLPATKKRKCNKETTGLCDTSGDYNIMFPMTVNGKADTKRIGGALQHHSVSSAALLTGGVPLVRKRTTTAGAPAKTKDTSEWHPAPRGTLPHQAAWVSSAGGGSTALRLVLEEMRRICGDVLLPSRLSNANAKIETKLDTQTSALHSLYFLGSGIGTNSLDAARLASSLSQSLLEHSSPGTAVAVGHREGEFIRNRRKETEKLLLDALLNRPLSFVVELVQQSLQRKCSSETDRSTQMALSVSTLRPSSKRKTAKRNVVTIKEETEGNAAIMDPRKEEADSARDINASHTKINGAAARQQESTKKYGTLCQDEHRDTEPPQTVVVSSYRSRNACEWFELAAKSPATAEAADYTGNGGESGRKSKGSLCSTGCGENCHDAATSVGSGRDCFTPPQCPVVQVQWRYRMLKCIDASPLVRVAHTVPSKKPRSPLQKVECSEGPQVLDTVAFVGSHSGHICCVDVRTGQERWQTHIGSRVESSAVLCGQKRALICVGCYDGRLYFLHCDTGKVHWVVRTGGEVKSSPCVDPATGYVWAASYDMHLYCCDADARAVVERVHCGALVYSSPQVVRLSNCSSSNDGNSPMQGLLFVGTHSGELVCLSLAGGSFSKDNKTSNVKQNTLTKIFWKLAIGPTSSPLFSSPLICSDTQTVFIGSCSNVVAAVSFSGEVKWTFTTRGPVFSSPCSVPSADAIAFGCHDGFLYLLDKSTGHLLATSQSCSQCLPGVGAAVSSPIYASPAVVGRSVIVFACLGGALCFASVRLERTGSSKSDKQQLLRDERVMGGKPAGRVVAATITHEHCTLLPGPISSSPVCVSLSLPEEASNRKGTGDHSRLVLIGTRENAFYAFQVAL